MGWSVSRKIFIHWLSSSDGGCIVVSEEVERLRIQSQSELEVFVKKFAKKYRPLFRNGTFSYRFQPNLDFLYEVYLEIQLAEWAVATFRSIPCVEYEYSCAHASFHSLRCNMQVLTRFLSFKCYMDIDANNKWNLWSCNLYIALWRTCEASKFDASPMKLQG